MFLTKKLFILIFLLIFSMIMLAQTTTQPLPPSNFEEIDAGTGANPYLISNLANLRWLSENDSAIGSPINKIHFRQTADIDAMETMDWNGGRGFLPIGLNGFWGVYDGNRYNISNLYFSEDPDAEGRINYIAMFYGCINSTLKNIKIENVSIDGERGFFSPLAVFVMDSEVINCSASGEINIVHTGGPYDFTNAFSGGLVNRAIRSDVRYCYSTVTINETFGLGYTGSGVVGGVVGEMDDSVLSNSFFYGAINKAGNPYSPNLHFTGSLVAIASNSVIYYSYGTTSHIIHPFHITGAIVGGIETSSITNNFWNIETTGLSNLYGEIWESPTKIEDNFGLTILEMKQAQTFIDNGWDFENIWAIIPEINNGFPFLKNMPPEIVSIGDVIADLVGTGLKGNYPNPFNPETTITFTVGNAFISSDMSIGTIDGTNVSIEIFNIRGQRVRRLLDAYHEIGEHSVVWNGKDDNGQQVSSGVYFYKMVAGDVVDTKRMVLLK